ncbi:hypothetical protein [Aestuariivivens sediminis]|uniref:hypothetical protein n=1 Tax=Aestuariivivens sediminis TaxID=2913557 RepID=UPI001F59635B|nr:hypothetical protein [Aestuariivivens sediminis]
MICIKAYFGLNAIKGPVRGKNACGELQPLSPIAVIGFREHKAYGMVVGVLALFIPWFLLLSFGKPAIP